jgi:hypothetical protein
LIEAFVPKLHSVKQRFGSVMDDNTGRCCIDRRS